MPRLKCDPSPNLIFLFLKTGDLSRVKSSNISNFRDKVLYGSFLKLLSSITNIAFTSSKIDVTSSKYEFSDYLLCHDDDIHDVNKHGRRIAFVYYMVPEWSPDGSDGGNLDLFKVNGKQTGMLLECACVGNFSKSVFFN